MGNLFSHPFHGERPDLADFHPGLLWQTHILKFKRERKASHLRLACNDHGNDSLQTLVKHIPAADQNRA